MTDETPNSVELATELTIAWLGNQQNRVSAEDVPTFLKTMHATLLELASPAAADAPEAGETGAEETFEPAVTVRKSLASKDHIISMIDGKPYKTLRRHLSTHGLTDVQYRARYKLRSDYPMVAETYSEARRAMARQIGLGRKGRGAAPDEATPPVVDTPPAAAETKPARKTRAPRKAKAEA